MRVLKSLNELIPLKLVWLRITSNRWTQAFFLVALAHCLIQLGLESWAFASNNYAINRLESILEAGNGQIDQANLGLAVWTDGRLVVCQGLPGSDSCKTVWAVNALAVNTSSVYGAGDVTPTVIATAVIEPVPSSTPSIIDAAPIASASVLPPSVEGADVDEVNDDDDADDTSLVKRTIVKRDMVPTFDASGAFLGLLIEDPRLADGSILVSQQCISSLQIPLQALQNAQRTDVTFLSFQLWVFGMSFVAILNESVPHIVASFLTHIVATLWSGYQVHHTDVHRASFERLVVQGPCKANILPDYWSQRDYAEIIILSMNAFVTVVIAFLSYKLLKAFGWQTFKKIGASFAINRCYRMVLAFSITIQLAVFFVGANIALWLDQLNTGIIGPFAEHKKLYLAVYIVALVFLGPWLAIGWFAVRRESRVWMATFLVMAILMITGWASMFASRSFLWTFRIWEFFSFMTVAAAVLLAAAISLGVACRLNFGHGLSEYLIREELGEEPDWEPAMEKTYGDEEKHVQFPSESSPHPVPAFSDAFVGPEGMDRLRAMSRPAARSGPGIGMHARGTSTSGSVDFGSGLPARPNAAVTVARTASNASRSTTRSSLTLSPTGQPVINPTDPRLNLARINTVESQRSYTSQNSGTSAGSRLKGQRWEIDM